MVRTRLIFSVILSIAILAGCYRPVVQSNRRDVNTSVTDSNTIGYYLPKGMISISLTPDTDQYNLTIEPLIIPDPNHFYTLSYLPSAFSDDTVGVDFASSNTERPVFIQKLSTKVIDRWADIVDRLAAIAREGGKLARPFPGAGAVPLARPQFQQFLDVVIDPDDAGALKRVNDFLLPNGIAVKVEPLGFEKSSVTSAPVDQKGIYTRLTLPYKVSVVSTLTPVETSESSTQVVKIHGVVKNMVFNLPNGSPILALDVTRALFVRKDTVLEFDEGRLTKYQLAKPSEALGFVMIPYNLAQDIIGLPSELFSLRINLPSQQAKLLNEKTQELSWRNKVLDELKKKKSPPDFN